MVPGTNLRLAQKDYWNRLLPHYKHRRGRIRRGGLGTVDYIKDRVSIHQRAERVKEKEEPGHWEADLMLFSQYGQILLITHERSSRLLLATRQPSKASQPIMDHICDQMKLLPKRIRQTITFDNGTEFTRHHHLRDKLDIKTYFCDPRSPWQKGGVENAIGRIRRFLPRYF